MKTRSIKIIKKAPTLLCLLLAVCLLCGTVVGCATNRTVNTDALISDGTHELPVWFYEFLLSRMKAELARQKYDVNNPDFWDQPIDGEGSASWRESCENSVLESMRMYLAALILFEQNELELTNEYFDSIEEDLSLYEDLDADGSRAAFNQLLAAYGVDYEALRDAYADEYRVALLQTYLYGKNGALIADNVKEEYFEANYYRFRQIMFANVYYEYVTDQNGDTVYYDASTGKILYDSESGTISYDADGKEVKDTDGQTVYCREDGHIAYDTVNGKPMYITNDQGEAEAYPYLSSEMEARLSELEALRYEIGQGNTEAFDAAVIEKSDDKDGITLYPNGYYLSDLEAANFSDDYLGDILEKLKTMNIGDSAILESEYGYHLIMRYPVEEGDYKEDDYEVFFTSFSASLISDLFRDKCQKLFETFTVSEQARKNAKDIAEIGINYNY